VSGKDMSIRGGCGEEEGQMWTFREKLNNQELE
jgi:hypothetical protein